MGAVAAHGPSPVGRPAYPCLPDGTMTVAERAGLYLVRRREAGSIQQANRASGVRWTWLVLARPIAAA